MPREDIEIQDLIRENRRYYNQVRDGAIPFDYAEYQRKINLYQLGQLKYILNTD